MQDGKALQAGTSHFLGQNFAKAFDVKYASKEGKLEYVWASSWGVSTRLMGALIMTHSDDLGLVLPPILAPIQVVLIPIYHSQDEFKEITLKLKEISDVLKSKNIRVIEDFKDTRKPGWKFSEYELKGVPIRIAMGPKDVKNNSVEIFRRDTLSKQNVKIVDIAQHIEDTLDSIQKKLFEKAKKFNKENTHYADNFEDFKEKINLGGFVYAHWDGTSDTENTIKKITKATIRTIPLNEKSEKGICVYSGKPSTRRVVFAKSY